MRILNLASCLVISLAIATTSPSALGCSGVEFGTGAQTTVAQNIGWLWKLNTALVINQRGMSKFAMTQVGKQSLTWTSKYGSVSSNPIGREFPISGVNEKGLTVQGLQAPEAVFPAPAAGVTGMDVFQWVQYQLDLSSSVADAIALAQTVQPVVAVAGPVNLLLHYMICDATGACATFDWPNGGPMEIHSGAQLPVQALTNSDYDDSLSMFNGCKSSPCSASDDSLNRFIQIAFASHSYDNAIDPIQYGIKTLKSVKQVYPLTLWNVVVQTAGGAGNGPLIYNLKSPTANAFQFVDLKTLDFSCSHPTQMQEVDLTATGDVGAGFKDYDPSLQTLLVSQTRVTGGAGQAYIDYPSQVTCVVP